MNIVIIGPVYPYRGGIAQFTSLLFRELSKKHKVTMISYKLQYPKFLSRRSTQKDFDSDTFKVEQTNYLINTVNPISYFSTAKFIKKIKPDIVIAQWWNPFFAFSYSWILGSAKKYSDVIIQCHNVLPHDKLPLQKILTKMTFKRADSFIVHSQADGEKLLKLKPTAKFKQTVHPTYNVFNISGISKERAREKLGISKESNVILFFGFVREYKGLKYLLEAMPKITDELDNARLLVVGDILDSEKDDYFENIKSTGCADSINLISNYVPDNEVENYYAACDVVVLPYLSATQSGIVQIAFGFNKPVIVTNVGGLPDVVTNEVTGFVVPPRDSKALSDAIIRFFKENISQQMTLNIMKESYRFSWERLAEVIEQSADDNTNWEIGIQ